MIDIKLTRLINSVPVGYLTSKLWITKGGRVLPVELNEFADYTLKPNPKPDIITLSVDDYERMTREYFATLPKVDERQLEPIAKHLPGKHDQSSHGRKKGAKYSSKNYDRLVGSTSEDFQAVIADLPVSPEVKNSTELRFAYRSIPAPKELKGEFDKLDEQLKGLTDNNPVSIMTEESVIENILEDGEVRSIFAFDEGMKGTVYREHRTIYEKIAFDYDADLPVEMRPISGIVFPTDMNNDLLDTFGQNYGSVQLVLKDEVKSRTSLTLDDSLDYFQRPFSMGGSAPRTTHNVFHALNANEQADKGDSIFNSKSWWSSSYIEAQVHGGVKLKDIEKIVFHYPENVDMEFMEFRLGELGIPFEVVE